MGANQSTTETRSVSMDNPTPSGVIDISDEVVQRLKLGIMKKEEAKPETTQAVPVTEPKKVSPPIPVQKQEAHITPPKMIYPNPTTPPSAVSPYPRFEGEPTITSVEMRRQKEIELRENDKLWRARMVKLEEDLNKTNAVMEKEFDEAYEEVRKRFTNSTGTLQVPPCQDFKAQLIACYRAYPGETLKCSEEVKRFTNCVASHRIKKINSEQPTAKGA